MTQGPTVYLVGNFTITDETLMNDYGALAVPFVHKHGGRVLSADRHVTALEGAAKTVVVVIEFPNRQAADAFYTAPEYEPMKQMRLDATTGGFVVFAEGVPAA